MYPFWTDDDYAKLTTLSSYKEMVPVALAILQRIPSPRVLVSGPISTGGRGSIDENARAMREAILQLAHRGINVFSQMPFQDPMVRVMASGPAGVYAHEILHHFYLPLFESRLIDEMYFLPDWESSIGAAWEHEQAVRLRIVRHYLAE